MCTFVTNAPERDIHDITRDLDMTWLVVRHVHGERLQQVELPNRQASVVLAELRRSGWWVDRAAESNPFPARTIHSAIRHR